MSTKTVKNAAAKLPEGTRASFLRAWKATHAMDLYEGRVEEYMQVIAQMLESQNEHIARLEAACSTTVDKMRNVIKFLRKI